MELRKEGERTVLNTYGELKIAEGKDGKTGKIDILHIPEKQLSDMLRQLIIATKATAKDAVFSIPVFSSFVTLIDMPVMSLKELAGSIEFEARKYIPIPTSEVQFSWSIVEKPDEKIAQKIINQEKSQAISAGENTFSQVGIKSDNIRVLLVAVPNDIVAKYKSIIKRIGISADLEIETFSITRSLIKRGIDDNGVVIIVDIGGRSTEICVVDRGLLRLSHNFEASGASITKAISISANVDIKRAEEFKMKKGLKLSAPEKPILDSILPLIDMIVFEIERTNVNYQQRTGRKAQKIILAGGTSNLPGLVDYLSNQLGIMVAIADPFSNLSSSPILSKTLREIGPTFSVAVGLAERNLV